MSKIKIHYRLTFYLDVKYVIGHRADKSQPTILEALFRVFKSYGLYVNTILKTAPSWLECYFCN